uniref:Uncharacterized protein n=1 Tax=Leptobrachium leishanense TaxID=445787 RepID=A0A8C5PLV1_9ANUR
MAPAWCRPETNLISAGIWNLMESLTSPVSRKIISRVRSRILWLSGSLAVSGFIITGYLDAWILEEPLLDLKLQTDILLSRASDHVTELSRVLALCKSHICKETTERKCLKFTYKIQ